MPIWTNTYSPWSPTTDDVEPPDGLFLFMNNYRIPLIKFGDGNVPRLAGFVKIGLFSGILKEFYK
jgi:hypothetical protein